MEKSFRFIFGVSALVFQLLLHADAICFPTLLPGGTLTPKYGVGDIAELKCDVSSRNTEKDTLHWKRGNEVMSQDKIIVPKYQKKFNISLEENVYTLRFVVEPNDSGKYNCTCASGGLQYYLWVKTNACPLKVAAETTSKPNYVVGDTAELKCQVSSYDPKKNVLYWRRDNKIITHDMKVNDKYSDRYNVSLKDDVYTLRWIVKEDDVGKYICLCDSNQLQFELWATIPCNKPSFLVDSSSQVVKDYIKTKKPLELASNQSVTFDLNLDCGCTYPGPGRKVKGTWMIKNNDNRMTRYQGFQDTVVELDKKATPKACYTKPDPIVYRFNNVKAHFQKVTFSCNHGVGLEFFFFLDEDQEGAEPMMGVHCTGPGPGLSVGAIAGIVIGVIIAVAIIIGFPVSLCIRCNRHAGGGSPYQTRAPSSNEGYPMGNQYPPAASSYGERPSITMNNPVFNILCTSPEGFSGFGQYDGQLQGCKIQEITA